MRQLLAGILMLFSLCVSAQVDYVVQHYSVEDGLSQNTVMAIMQDRDGFMWFGTWDGLNRFDGYKFTTYKSHPNTPNNVMKSNRVDEIYEDSLGYIWFMTNDKLFYKLDKRTEVITAVSASEVSRPVQRQMQNDSICIDSHGVIWQVNDEVGISRCRNGQWKRMCPPLDKRYAGQLRRNFFALEDKQGRLWINPTGGGFSCYDYEKDELSFPIPNLTNMIHTAYFDKQGGLWLSTYDKGIDHVSIQPKLFDVHDLRPTAESTGEVRAMIELNGRLQTFTKDKLIYCVTQSPYGLLYGTKGNGIQGRVHVDSKDIYDLAVDADNTLYVGTYGDGVFIVPYGEEPRQCGNGLKVRDILITDSLVLAGTTTGLYDVLNDTLIPFYDVRNLYVDYKGQIWVGTFGGGLNILHHNKGTYSLENIDCGQDIVLSMQMDQRGNVWFTSEHNIVRYNPQTQSVRTFDVLHKERDAYFSEAEAIRLDNGDIVFGYSNGYCQFTPENIILSTNACPMAITGFQVQNEDRQVTNDTLVIHHDESIFSIEYAAIDYDNGSKIDYAYMLDGFDHTWNEVGKQRKATYTNLKPGRYRFVARSTNAEGVWTNNNKSVIVVVEPSFWQTGWALLMYIVLIGLLLYGIYRFVKMYTHLRQEMQVEQKVTDIKLRFFTNISHELRTPLTLITGPVENILKNEKLTPNVRTQLEIVRSNSHRMLRLINQILDFRKIQNQKMRLRVQYVQMDKLAMDVCANFRKEAFDKQIQFDIINNAPKIMAWVDKEKVDTILFNLLSNAFKFTPSGKSVIVTIDEKPDFVLLEVSDTGVGIPNDKRSILFERFRSQNEIHSNSDTPGTGIGLNLVKELVDLHQGYIEVESELNKGTIFTVMFRKGKEHYGSDVDIITDQTEPIPEPATPAPKLKGKLDLQVESKSKRTMLVVEDNDDMRTFLQEVFADDFNVILASDGLEGVEAARTHMPDLIISDLMMPKMSGDELTQKLKKDRNTCHIPIILLTAKTAIESKISALEYGADDYLTKPFSSEYLQARVNNILKQYNRLQENYREKLLSLDPKELPVQDANELFLIHLMDFMEKNMDNNHLTVEDLVKEMALGRTVFFNKLKSLTGLAPVEFIRETRIKRAAQLIESGQYTVTEVTFMVGMNDVRYFSKCFKAVYGMTPTDLKRKVDEDAANNNLK